MSNLSPTPFPVLMLLDEVGSLLTGREDSWRFTTGAILFECEEAWLDFEPLWNKLLVRFGQVERGSCRKGNKAPPEFWPAFAQAVRETTTIPTAMTTNWEDKDSRDRLEARIKFLIDTRKDNWLVGRGVVPPDEIGSRNFVWSRQIEVTIALALTHIVDCGIEISGLDLHVDKKSLNAHEKSCFEEGVRMTLRGDIREYMQMPGTDQEKRFLEAAGLYRATESTCSVDYRGRHKAMSVVDHWCALLKRALHQQEPTALAALESIRAYYSAPIIDDLSTSIFVDNMGRE
ncbi:MAG: hypothetical protein HYZ53_04790 [Planctomycetes bacterium]|nr:hypothetical protein [Planctomycetota bacterium]